MKNQLTRRALICLVLAVPLALILVGSVYSAPRQGEGYDLSWWTVDGGGGTLSDGSSGYALAGTAGQADAAVLAGSGYTLEAGFWGGAGREQWYRIMLMLVFRSYEG